MRTSFRKHINSNFLSPYRLRSKDFISYPHEYCVGMHMSDYPGRKKNDDIVVYDDITRDGEIIICFEI